MNVLFLDYDGVVNTPMWDGAGKRCTFNFPKDNKVNNFQCVQWVSEFCQKYNYKIVVSSTWRMDENYKECLINGGLRENIEIIGATPVLKSASRSDEILEFLIHNDDITDYMIFDDERIDDYFINHFVHCDPNRGFGIEEFYEAERLIQINAARKELGVYAI